MDYFKLEIFTGDDYEYMTKMGIDEETVETILDGLKISSGDIPVTITDSDKQIPDLMGLGSDLIVVSTKLKVIFEDYDREYLQFFEIALKNRKQNYWLMNILENKSCFDKSYSKYSTYPSNPKVIRHIDELVLQRDLIGDRNIFRMEESPTIVVVSQAIKNVIEIERITGIKLSPIKVV